MPTRILCLVTLLTCTVHAVRAADREKVWPKSAPISGAQIRVNEWTAIEEHGASRRRLAGLAYLPDEQSWLLFMGAPGAWNDLGPFPYDEQTFDLKGRVWKNRFPFGKESWGPEAGVCQPPPFRGHGYRIEDVEGNIRLGLWEGRFHAYYQYALDSDRNRLVAYVKRHTLEYDPRKRTWKDLNPQGDPQEGCRFELWWGSICYDPINKEFVLFGGNNGASEYNDTRTWVYSVADNQWRRQLSGSDRITRLHKQAKALRVTGTEFYGALLNRYFQTELPHEGKTSLSGMANFLSERIEAFSRELAGKAPGHEKTQCERAAAELESASELLGQIGDSPNPDSLKAALALKRALRRAEDWLLCEPPPRAYSPMVYDPSTEKTVLFGGDRLDMLYADTWVYDCRTRSWQRRRPAVSPSPRAGHAFVYLPEARKLALLGGYGFDSQTGYWGALYKQLPMQVWTYDVDDDRWDFITEWPVPERNEEVPNAAPRFMQTKGQSFLAAVGDDDVVLFAGPVTYACRLDVSRPDAPGTVKRGIPPGTVEWRDGPYDPDWYLDGPPPAEEPFRKVLEAVPVNQWTVVTPKEMRLPRQNRDWGTAVFDPDRDAIYRWSGGHSAHCGSDIPIFSMKTGRYHQKYPPAFPLEGIGSCGSQPSRSTFLGQPWISAHSYHSYAYDPVSKRMICCGHQSFSFVFNPNSGTWTCKPQPEGMAEDNFYTLTLCSTRHGPYAWTRFGTLFHYDGRHDAWAEVELQGESLVETRCDNSGMCYDAKRDRLTMTHSEFQGDLMAVDLKTRTAKRLSPRGMAAAAKANHFLRETCYHAAHDIVLVPTRGKRGDTAPVPWVLYDCASNAWTSVDIGGPNPTNVSMGLMYDPKRELVIAVDTNSVVYVLRLDPVSATPIEDEIDEVGETR